MSVLVANNANSILASPITAIATSLTVNAGDGAKFPNPSAPDFFFCTLISAANPAVYEIVRVTARTTDTFTIVRAQDGTAAQSFSASDIVALLPTRATENAIRNYVSLPTSTGTANAQLVVNTTPFLAAPLKGAVQTCIPGFTNTGALTFGVDGFTPAAVLAWGQACKGGEFVVGVPTTLVFDGTNWNALDPQVGYRQLPTSTGSANAQAVANTIPVVALVDGTVQRWYPGFTNTGPMTLAADGTAATQVFNNGAACLGGECQANIPIEAVYSSANSAWNIINAASVSAAGSRNFFVDPCCRSAQNPNTVNLSTSKQYGNVDLVQIWASAGAVSAGTLVQAAAQTLGAPSATGYAARATGVTLTGSAAMSARRWLEGNDAEALAGAAGTNTATFSCIVQQNTGGPINYTIAINRATALNNFASTANIGTSGNISVPSGVPTLISFTVALTAACLNGIEMVVAAACGAVTTKNFDWTDFDAHIGTYLRSCPVPQWADEFSNVQRYFERSFEYGQGGSGGINNGALTYTSVATGNGAVIVKFVYRKNKVVTPGITVTSSGTGNPLRIFDSNTSTDITVSTTPDTSVCTITNNSGGALTASHLLVWQFVADARL